MALNPRETTIAWVVGATVGVAILYYAFQSFYLDPVNDLRTQITTEQEAARKKQQVLDSDKSATMWSQFELPSGDAASTKVLNAAFLLAPNLPFNIVDYKSMGPGRAISKNDFEEWKFKLSVSGTWLRVASYIYSLEKSPIAMKVEDVTINTRKEGTDDLVADITLSALVYAPKATTKPGATKPRPASTQTEEQRQAAQLRAMQEARKASLAAETQPQKTPEQLELEMAQRRAAELGQTLPSQPSPAPGTAPAAALAPEATRATTTTAPSTRGVQ